MPHSALQPGDHLAVNRGYYTHHGLYVGHHQVIHYYGSLLDKARTGQVVQSSLNAFLEGQSYQVIPHPDRRFNRETCIVRAHARLGEQRYHLLFNNCEHFVCWCIDDDHHSPQIEHATVIAATGLAAALPATTTRTVGSVLAGACTSAVTTSPAASATLISLTAVATPAWAPLAVGVAVAYTSHRLLSWLWQD